MTWPAPQARILSAAQEVAVYSAPRVHIALDPTLCLLRAPQVHTIYIQTKQVLPIVYHAPRVLSVLILLLYRKYALPADILLAMLPSVQIVPRAHSVVEEEVYRVYAL